MDCACVNCAAGAEKLIVKIVVPFCTKTQRPIDVLPLFSFVYPPRSIPAAWLCSGTSIVAWDASLNELSRA